MTWERGRSRPHPTQRVPPAQLTHADRAVTLRFQKWSLVEQVADALRREIESGACRGWLPTERTMCSDTTSHYGLIS